MSYTLRGRLESRVGATLLVVVAACVLALAEHKWWPVEAAGLMLGVGLTLDVLAYDRLLRYQPGWAALPLGLLELGLVILFMHVAGVAAPLSQAVALFAAGWLVAQFLGHAAFPLLRLGYAEEGGELGSAGGGRGGFRRRRCSRPRARRRTRCGRRSSISLQASTRARSSSPTARCSSAIPVRSCAAASSSVRTASR